MVSDNNNNCEYANFVLGNTLSCQLLFLVLHKSLTGMSYHIFMQYVLNSIHLSIILQLGLSILPKRFYKIVHASY